MRTMDMDRDNRRTLGIPKASLISTLKFAIYSEQNCGKFDSFTESSAKVCCRSDYIFLHVPIIFVDK